MWRSFSLILILCVVIGVNCWSGDNCDGCTRNKRGKYYSIPSYKYYNRPTYSYANRGPLYMSHGYTLNDIAHKTKTKPYKVSNRPINEGLGDEDFNNLMKYLSNKDLDKIVEFASEKEMYRDHIDNYKSSGDFRYIDYEEDSSKVYPYDPNLQYDYNRLYNPSTNYPQGQANNMNNMYFQEHNINTEELEETEQLSQLDEFFQKEIKVMSNKNNIFTDSSSMNEEELPKPINLREDDYDGSFTNNVPSLANPDTTYRLESFADLPLMEYINSKSEKVNSYSVPHYSVISPSDYQQRLPPSPLPPSQPPASLSPSILSLINAPEVEPAPPVSSAKEQSDAHLKATKIWTHKSKGTAYTLHDDGTLSLENPARPRYRFS